MSSAPAGVAASGGRPPIVWRRVLEASIPILMLGALAFWPFPSIPSCPTRALFGLPCPGCGLTRSTLAFLSGDLAGVWRYHPLAPIVTPLVVLLVSRPLLEALGVKNARRWTLEAQMPSCGWTTILVAMLGLYVVRAFGLLGGLPDAIDPSQGWLTGPIAGVVHAHAH